MPNICWSYSFRIHSKTVNIYICGDFNADLLQHYKKNDTNNCIDHLYSFGLHPLITRPTRITTHSKTLIDNIFTTNLSNIQTVRIHTVMIHYRPTSVNVNCAWSNNIFLVTKCKTSCRFHLIYFFTFGFKFFVTNVCVKKEKVYLHIKGVILTLVPSRDTNDRVLRSVFLSILNHFHSLSAIFKWLNNREMYLINDVSYDDVPCRALTWAADRSRELVWLGLYTKTLISIYSMTHCRP